MNYYLKFDNNGFQVESTILQTAPAPESGFLLAPEGFVPGDMHKLVNGAIVELTTPEQRAQALIDQTFDVRMEQLRMRRNVLLSLSDWTQVADSPLTSAKKGEWATYRAALRALPNSVQAGQDPAAVAFPTQPE
jgi:hypothetical protein